MPQRIATPSELPPPSPEFVLLRVHVEAVITVLGRKKAERYLRLMAEALAQEDNLAAVFRIRPTGREAEYRAAQQQASAMFQRCLPLWLARVPRA